MFISNNKLSEGRFDQTSAKQNPGIFSEGENPGYRGQKLKSTNWKSDKTPSRSNASWEKLRK
jgi:hypothetical protein